MKLKKHSAMIQISNKITLRQRKTYNFLLVNAKKSLYNNEMLGEFNTSISEIKRETGINTTDNKSLKDDIRALQTTLVEFNILGKDGNEEEWLSLQLVGQVKILRGDGSIKYQFSPAIREALLNPKIYGLVDMKVIKGFDSKYSIALYELLEDYKNVSIPKMIIEDFRKLMGIEDKYDYFGQIRNKVINVAIEEINNKTNFNVSYEVDKYGNKITHIKFNHTYKKDVEKIKLKKFTNFKEFQKYVIENFKDKKICNNVESYQPYVIFSLNDIGYIINDYANELLQADESLKIWSWLFKNQDKLGVIEDIDIELIEAKKLINTEFNVITTNALGGESEMKLILKDIDRDVDNKNKFIIFFNDVNNPQKENSKSKQSYTLNGLNELLKT